MKLVNAMPAALAASRPGRAQPFADVVAENLDAVYRYLYPSQFDLPKISYFFEDDRPTLPPSDAYADCLEQVDAWKARWDNGPKPTMTYVKAWGTLTIHVPFSLRRVSPDESS